MVDEVSLAVAAFVAFSNIPQSFSCFQEGDLRDGGIFLRHPFSAAGT